MLLNTACTCLYFLADVFVDFNNFVAPSYLSALANDKSGYGSYITITHGNVKFTLDCPACNKINPTMYKAKDKWVYQGTGIPNPVSPPSLLVRPVPAGPEITQTAITSYNQSRFLRWLLG